LFSFSFFSLLAWNTKFASGLACNFFVFEFSIKLNFLVFSEKFTLLISIWQAKFIVYFYCISTSTGKEIYIQYIINLTNRQGILRNYLGEEEQKRV